MKIIDHDFVISKVVPPIGKYQYAASLNFVAIETDDGVRKHLKPLPDLHEALGVTKEEARGKMQREFDEWLEHNLQGGQQV